MASATDQQPSASTETAKSTASPASYPVKRMGAREARNNFADLIGQVHYGETPVIIERSGNPMVAVIPVSMLNRYLNQRERDFTIIDEIRAKAPDRPFEEVEQDVEAAIAAVRAEYRADVQPQDTEEETPTPPITSQDG